MQSPNATQDVAAQLQQLAENATPESIVRIGLEVNWPFVVHLEIRRTELMCIDEEELRRLVAPIVEETIANLGAQDSVDLKTVIEAEADGVNLIGHQPSQQEPVAQAAPRRVPICLMPSGDLAQRIVALRNQPYDDSTQQFRQYVALFNEAFRKVGPGNGLLDEKGNGLFIATSASSPNQIEFIPLEDGADHAVTVDGDGFDEDQKRVFDAVLARLEIRPIPKSKSEHTAEILMHRIKWWLRSADTFGVELPSTLAPSAEKHIERMIREGFREGELNVTSEDSMQEFRGWWQIVG